MRALPLPRWLSRLLSVCAAASALLWLLPLFASRPVLFPAGPYFEDILVYKGRFSVYHSAKFFTSRAFSGFAYPPGAAPIYAAFYSTTSALDTYLLLATLTTIVALAAAAIFLHRKGQLRLFPWLLCFSFPLVFLIQRANIEIVLWALIALGVVAYRRGAAIVAAVLFGVAASVKLYPVLLLGLFLHRRPNLRAFFIGVATAVVSLIAAVAYTGPTFLIAARGFTTGVGRFQDHYVATVSSVEVAFDHSLFSPLKYVAYLGHTSPAAWTSLYYLVAGTFALLLFLRVRTLPSLNRTVFLLAAMVSLPPVSFTYTLVHLYLPLLLLLACAARAALPFTARGTLALLLFLTLPLNSLSVLTPIPAGPLQACALLAVLVLTTLQPWPEDVRAHTA